jgi:predicted phage terminase large subunit-like protein
MRQEWLRRLTVRGSLTEWARFKGFEPAEHHALIIREIEAFLESDDEVLLLFAPPGSAKSTYVSHLFPAWYLARNPTKNILAATHSVEFAERWGRRVRNDVATHGNMLNLQLAADTTAAARWGVTSGGEYYGVGAGVGIAGFRADLGLNDDLFGNREDAYSPIIRAKRWDWYTDDFGARLKPGAKRILMNTRWHEEDVAGRVLEQIDRGIVRGRVISIRAIAEDDDVLGREPGEYLWANDPGYDYPSYLRQRQRETSPMMWDALFQQRPHPAEGSLFKAEWMHEHDALPHPGTLRYYGGSDYAVTADGGDFTVHVVCAIDPQRRLWVVDLWRKQAAADEWIGEWVRLVKQWKPLQWGEEAGQINSAVGPFLTRQQMQAGAMTARRQFASRHDKATRAQSVIGYAALYGIHVQRDAPWWPVLRAELLGFPAAKYDDQVDALGLVGQLLATAWDGEGLPVPPKPLVIDPRPPTWNELINEVEKSGRI